LARIWSEVLGVERVSRNDSFFDLGGHSLLAMRVLSRVEELLGIDFPLTRLFEEPTLAKFSQSIYSKLHQSIKNEVFESEVLPSRTAVR
jgi:acyl carrier protein